MKFAFLLLYVSLISCSLKKQNDIVLVKGIVKNLPTFKLYLTDASNWKVFLDSGDYKNDTFSFRINTEEFTPYLASIYFVDSNGKRQVLAYQNYLLATKKNNYAQTAFVLDKGVTTISGAYISNPTISTVKLTISGSKQNDPFFKTQLTGFGWVSAKDSLKRKVIINSFKRLIIQYPDSYYFIWMLYTYRFQYSKEELADMLGLFKSNEVTDDYKQKFKSYFKDLPLTGKSLHNYAFRNLLNQSKAIVDTSVNLNMIIFWASWCGPCRLEIPQLKQVFDEYKNCNMHMVSVSIDQDKEAWRSLLKKEDLGWEQLIVDSTQLENVKNSFNFNAIPLVVFTDSEGVEIARFSDYKPDNKSKYDAIIKKCVTNNEKTN